MRSILYDFVKIPQSFFCSKKTTAPFTREPLTDRGEPCPYGMIYNSILVIKLLLVEELLSYNKIY